MNRSRSIRGISGIRGILVLLVTLTCITGGRSFAVMAAGNDEITQIVPDAEEITEEVYDRADAEEIAEEAYDRADAGMAADPEWEWNEELEFDEQGNTIAISKVTARLRTEAGETEAEVMQGEETRAMDCIWPAIYKYTARAIVNGQEYVDENECAFGPVPSGHKLNLEWKLNEEDPAYPYYYPDWDKKLKCSECGEEVTIGFDRVDCIEGEDHPECDRDAVFKLRFTYFLTGDKGERLDIRPFSVDSDMLTIPATGIHGYMKYNDLPWWDWRYDEENDRWTAEAVFWCNGDIRYGEDSDEVTLTSTLKDDVTTYKATFKSDKFYNVYTGRMDRSVEYTSTMAVTYNGIEISGVQDMLYTGKAVTLDDLRVRLSGRDLQEGYDYTLKYENNVNAGRARVIVTGKGRFKGSIPVEYSIIPVNLGTENISLYDLTFVGNGKVQKKPTAVYYNGTVLPKSNYTVVYDDTSAGAYTTPGTYKVTVKAKNRNYTGCREYSIHILEPGSADDKLIDASKLKLSVDNNFLIADPWGDADWDAFFERDDKGNRRAYKVTYDNCDVTEAFESSYLDINQDSGAGYLIVESDPWRRVEIKDKNGNVSTARFGGTLSVKVNLKNTDIGTLKIDIPQRIDYCGHPVSRRDLVDQYGLKITDENSYEWNEEGERVKCAHVLNLNDQYTLTLKNNAKAGKMKVVITGKRGYYGTVTKNIEIAKVDLKALQANGQNDFEKEGSLLMGRWWRDEEDEDHFDMPKDAFYSKGGAVIEGLQVGYRAVNIWYDEESQHREMYDYWLDPKTDYVVKYNYASKTPKAGEKAELTVSGKGNYTGSITLGFDVVERDIRDTLVDVQAVAYKKSAIMKPFMAKTAVKDRNSGKTLQKDRDYTVEYYRPAFDEEGTILDRDKWTKINAGTKWEEVFGNDDMTPVGDGHSMVAMIEALPGSGYTGDVEVWYNIVKSVITPAEFKIKDQALGMNRWGDIDRYMYFMPGDEPCDLYSYLYECSDEEFKAWADRYFVKYPKDCRFVPILDNMYNVEKTGTGSVKIEVIGNPDPERRFNPGSRGGYAFVKFKIVNKDFIKN